METPNKEYTERNYKMGKSIQFEGCSKKRPEMCRDFRSKTVCALCNKDKVCYHTSLKRTKKKSVYTLEEHELCPKYFNKR